MGDGGLANCGNSQNCVQACPKGIPLTTSIAALTVIQLFNHLKTSLVVIKFNRFKTQNPFSLKRGFGLNSYRVCSNY